MAQSIMYPGIDNSPKTTLTATITASDTSIAVADAAKLPAGPNLATLGTGDNAEVVLYASISNNTLTDCIRGVGGTARIWAEGTQVYRAYTNKDHQSFIDNIKDLDNNKLGKAGSGGDLTVAFTVASAKTNIATGEKLAAMFGKIAKWYASFKNLAWKDSVGTVEIDANAVTNAKLASMAAKTLKGNKGAEAGAPADLSASDVRGLLNVANGADVTKTTLESLGAIDALADDDRIVVGDVSAAAGSRSKYVLWSAVKAAISTALQNVYAAKKHKDTHKTGGADALTAADIGAAASTHKDNHKVGGNDALTPSDIGAAAPATELSATLAASGWSNGVITVTGLTGVTASSKGNISLASTATLEQRTAAANANLFKTGQGSGSITITADGEVPAVNIPIKILIVN